MNYLSRTLESLNQDFETTEKDINNYIAKMQQKMQKLFKRKISLFCQKYNCVYDITKEHGWLFSFHNIYEQAAFITFQNHFPTKEEFTPAKFETILAFYNEVIEKYKEDPQSFYKKYNKDSFKLFTDWYGEKFSSAYNPEVEKHFFQKNKDCFVQILILTDWFNNGWDDINKFQWQSMSMKIFAKNKLIK